MDKGIGWVIKIKIKKMEKKGIWEGFWLLGGSIVIEKELKRKIER